MKRVFTLFIVVILLASGCTSKVVATPTPSPVGSTVYKIGTFSLTVPSDWRVESPSDSTSTFFYPTECTGMISLASVEWFDMSDTESTSLFLYGYASSYPDFEEIDLSAFISGECYGLSYQYHSTFGDTRWYNHLFLADAGTQLAAVQIAYPVDIPDEQIAIYDSFAKANMLFDNPDLHPQETGPIYDEAMSEYIYAKLAQDFSTTTWYRRIIGISVYDAQDKEYVEVQAKPLVANDNTDTVESIISMISKEKHADKAAIDVLETLDIPAYFFLCEAAGVTRSELDEMFDNNSVPGDECAEALSDYIEHDEEGGLERIAYTIHANYFTSCAYVVFKYDDEIVYTVDFK